MKTCLLALLCLGLVACVGSPKRLDSQGVFADTLFPNAPRVADAKDILKLGPGIQRLLDEDFRGRNGGRDPRRWLMAAIADHQGLALQYDASLTRTAAEAFDSRAGNCLSLALLTGGVARELGVPMRYQTVYVRDTWSRSRDLTVASGHVNVALPDGSASSASLLTPAPGTVTIDFLPSEDLEGQRSREVSEQTVVAMYMNNRAAETLAEGDLDQAYAWARAAIRQDPSFLNTYNTLGVIYLRHGNLAEAERSLRVVLAAEPENTPTMSNLVNVLAAQGRPEESRKLADRLAKIDPDPPFYYFDQGVEAMKRGDYAAARTLFKREIRRAAYYHEFHFWLALADLGLGDPDGARKHLAIALENSASPKDHALYAAKLDWLNQRRVQ